MEESAIALSAENPLKGLAVEPEAGAEAREAATRLSEALDALLAAWRPEPGPPEVPSLTPAQRAMLEALGYGR